MLPEIQANHRIGAEVGTQATQVKGELSCQSINRVELHQKKKGESGQLSEKLSHQHQRKISKKFLTNFLVELAKSMVKLSPKSQETVK